MKSTATDRSTGEAGRVNQKRRTRQALIDAALALRDENRNPTLAEVAERALVSRATAYRYFASLEALVSETVTERGMQPLEQVWRPGDDPVAAIGRAARAMHLLLLKDEVGLHVMERSFMSVWLDAGGGGPRRPGRRLTYIEPIVDSLRDRLSPGTRRRLKHALSMVIGTEALIALRDVAGASVDQALDAACWAAQSLLRQALTEAARPTRNRRA